MEEKKSFWNTKQEEMTGGDMIKFQVASLVVMTGVAIAGVAILNTGVKIQEWRNRKNQLTEQTTE